MDSDSAKCHPEGRLLYWGLERERGEALEAPRGQFLNASVWLLKGWKHPWVPGAELSDACSREHRKCYWKAPSPLHVCGGPAQTLTRGGIHWLGVLRKDILK